MKQVVTDIESGAPETLVQKVKSRKRVIILSILLGSVTSLVFGTLLVLAFHPGQPFDGKRMIGYGIAFVFGLLVTTGACGFACGRRSTKPIRPIGTTAAGGIQNRVIPVKSPL